MRVKHKIKMLVNKAGFKKGSVAEIEDYRARTWVNRGYAVPVNFEHDRVPTVKLYKPKPKTKKSDG